MRSPKTLWLDGQAEEAMTFYTSIFKNSKVGSVMRYGDTGPGPKGSVMSATFELDGQEFTALNGGPHFTGHLLLRQDPGHVPAYSRASRRLRNVLTT